MIDRWTLRLEGLEMGGSAFCDGHQVFNLNRELRRLRETGNKQKEGFVPIQGK